MKARQVYDFVISGGATLHFNQGRKEFNVVFMYRFVSTLVYFNLSTAIEILTSIHILNLHHYAQ